MSFIGTSGRNIIISIGIALLYCLSKQYFNNQNKLKPRIKPKKEIHEVLMFSYTNKILMKSKYSRCQITESMNRMLNFLNSARHTVDICMYVITNTDIKNTLTKLTIRGVKIRLIVDADMAYSTGSAVKNLEKHGVLVRWMKSTNMMHHKFCLIDAKCEKLGATPLVMVGSLNWTNQALYGNWENVLVTSQEQIVSQYSDEYESLWKLFRPIVM